MSSFKEFFDKIGTVGGTKSDYDSFLQSSKQKEAILAKNAKLKAVKKPEEPLPYIEEVTFEEATGKYFKKQYANLQFLNLVGNQLEDDHDYTFLDNVLTRASNLNIILACTKLEGFIDGKLAEKHSKTLYIK